MKNEKEHKTKMKIVENSKIGLCPNKYCVIINAVMAGVCFSFPYIVFHNQLFGERWRASIMERPGNPLDSPLFRRSPSTFGFIGP